MKKKVYIRPISVMLSNGVFDQIKTITDRKNIAISDFIRAAIQEKLENKNNGERENDP